MWSQKVSSGQEIIQVTHHKEGKQIHTQIGHLHITDILKGFVIWGSWSSQV